MKLIYPGPSESVDIPSHNITASRGKPVDIDDPALAASLVDQGWQKPKPKKAAAKKAAATPIAGQQAAKSKED